MWEECSGAYKTIIEKTTPIPERKYSKYQESFDEAKARFYDDESYHKSSYILDRIVSSEYIEQTHLPQDLIKTPDFINAMEAANSRMLNESMNLSMDDFKYIEKFKYPQMK